MTDYATLLRQIYLDEAQGDGFFGALVDGQPDEQRREKLRTLQTIEARTVTSMQRLLKQAGIGADPGDARRRGRERAQQVDTTDWDAFLRNLRDSLPHDTARFAELRDASKFASDPALTALVNHAQAIERFVELETAGDDKKSLRALTDYLRKPA